MTEGRKFDSEKPKMHLLPPNATLEVAKVLTFGAQKYDEENWRKLENAQKRYTSGALRHIFAHMGGELQDPCLLYTSPSPRDQRGSRMPSSA